MGSFLLTSSLYTAHLCSARSIYYLLPFFVLQSYMFLYSDYDMALAADNRA